MTLQFRLAICLLVIFSLPNYLQAQQSIPQKKEIEHTTGFWLGSYTKYRLSNRLFYYGEYHLRKRNQFVNDMAQIYLRFGLTYLVNKNFEVTGGIVTPFYWAPTSSQDDPNIDNVVPQYRLWQQFLLVQPFDRLKLYHTFRTEQRWQRDYEKGSPFELTYRFRYKFTSYYPLNHHKLVPKTLFASNYAEIFIQAGKTVIYNPLEDFRCFTGLGYIINENVQIQAGYMWTYRQKGSPYKYEFRHIPRLSVYHNFDFHRRSIERRKKRPIILENQF